MDDGGFVFAQGAGPAAPAPLWRLRRVDGLGIEDHFYTASPEERDAAVAGGVYEALGVACAVLSAPTRGTVPLVRLWHGRRQSHSFTADPTNLWLAVLHGACRNEGTAAHVFGAPGHPGTVPLWALHRPATGAHLYTTDPDERAAALAEGWLALGTACWVYPAEGGGHQRASPGSTSPK